MLNINLPQHQWKPHTINIIPFSTLSQTQISHLFFQFSYSSSTYIFMYTTYLRLCTTIVVATLYFLLSTASYCEMSARQPGAMFFSSHSTHSHFTLTQKIPFHFLNIQHIFFLSLFSLLTILAFFMIFPFIPHYTTSISTATYTLH